MVWDKTTYPLPDFNGATFELWEILPYTLLGKLTHWGRVTHICVNKPTIIGSDNGLSPGRRQAIIWTNAGIMLIRPLGTNFSEILILIQETAVGMGYLIQIVW